MIKACIDKFVSPHVAARVAVEESSDNLPLVVPGTPLGNTLMDSRESGFLLTGKKWDLGRTLNIAFMGGDARVIDRIKKQAERWLEFANVKFKWVASSEASNVRIAFDQNDGSWSYIGTDCLTVAANEPTMNYGWLEPGTSETEYARVVVHEFGHMLGMPHEHQHPKAGIPWDKEKVYAYYGGPPNNWSKEDIDNNLFARYDESQVAMGEFDRQSIMLYPVPNELTVGDYQIGWNVDLSDGDKKFISWQYPKGTAPEPPAPKPKRVSLTELARYPGHFFGIEEFTIYTGTSRQRVDRWVAKSIDG